MDIFFTIGHFLLILVGLPIGLISMFYFVPKKLGYTKTGIYLTITLGPNYFMTFLCKVFEKQIFTKDNVKELFEEQQILLVDKFELVNNEKLSAIV